MADEVKIPVKTTYDGRGFEELRRDAAKARREEIAATRAQIAEHRRLTSLTAKLDRDLAKESADAAKKEAAALRERNQLIQAGAGIALAAAAAAGAFYVESVGAAREATAAEAQLAAALKSTGGAAGVTKQELLAHASALEDITNFSDETTQRGQAMLLTFTRIGKEVFPAATKTMLDMSEAMDQDVKSSAIQLGKALNDPINGLSALTRVGVTFTQAQKDQIEALQKNGDLVGAQRIILAELNKEFGGSAEAARDAAGGVKDLEVAYGRLQEAVGATATQTGVLDLASKAGAKALNDMTAQVLLGTALFGKLTEVMGQTGQASSAFDTIANGADFLADTLRYAGPQAALLATAIEKITAAGRDMVKEQTNATDAHDKTAKSAEDQEEAERKAAQAMEESARKAKELADHLADVQQARENVARKLIDIEANAAKETQATWDEYFEKEQAAWQEHQTNVAKIQADAAKEAERIQRDLAKNIAKEEKAMQQDIAKIRKDSQKEIGRKLEDQAREEKRTRRQRQIEAKGDQRLFDFEMRQLAAEGEFNQIREAQQRRAIEQQIAAEKTAETDRQRQEDNRTEIERMRQDEADRIAERRAQAEERKQELRDQAAEDLAANQERLQEELAQEAAAYEQKMADLRQWRDDKLQQIKESKQESIAKLAEELTQNKDLTREEMEAMKEIASELGPEVGAQFAEGLNEGFAKNLKIQQIASEGMSNAGGSGVKINPAHPTVPTSIGKPKSGGATKTSIGTPFAGFAEGVKDFIVPPGFPNDSYTVGLSSGERVNVAPAGAAQGSNVFNINVNGPGGKELAGIIQRHVEAGVNEYHNMIATWSNQ